MGSNRIRLDEDQAAAMPAPGFMAVPAMLLGVMDAGTFQRQLYQWAYEQAQQAVQLLAARAALHEEHGLRVEGWLAAHDRENLDRARAALDGASFARAWDAGTNMTLAEAVQFALEATRDA